MVDLTGHVRIATKTCSMFVDLPLVATSSPWPGLCRKPKPLVSIRWIGLSLTERENKYVIKTGYQAYIHPSNTNSFVHTHVLTCTMLTFKLPPSHNQSLSQLSLTNLCSNLSHACSLSHTPFTCILTQSLPHLLTRTHHMHRFPIHSHLLPLLTESPEPPSHVAVPPCLLSGCLHWWGSCDLKIAPPTGRDQEAAVATWQSHVHCEGPRGHWKGHCMEGESKERMNNVNTVSPGKCFCHAVLASQYWGNFLRDLILRMSPDWAKFISVFIGILADFGCGLIGIGPSLCLHRLSFDGCL